MNASHTLTSIAPRAAAAACVIVLFFSPALVVGLRAGPDLEQPAPRVLETAEAWAQRHAAGGEQAPARPELGEAWRVYQLKRLSDVLRGDFLRATEQDAWVVTVRDGDALTGLLQVRETPGAGARVERFQSPAPEGISPALDRALRHAAENGRTGQLRELRALEYGLRALWLHTPGGDVFFPLADGSGPDRPWRAAEPCSAADLAAWLKPLAEDLLRRQLDAG